MCTAHENFGKIKRALSLLPVTFCLQFFLAGASHAQADVNQIQRGTGIVTITSITSYRTPPQGGSLYRIPPSVGSFQPGTQLTVSDSWLIIRNPKGGEEKWVQLRADGSWVYVGEPGKKSCCFAIR